MCYIIYFSGLIVVLIYFLYLTYDNIKNDIDITPKDFLYYLICLASWLGVLFLILVNLFVFYDEHKDKINKWWNTPIKFKKR